MTGFWGVLVGVEVSVSSTVGVRKVFSGVGVAVAGPLVGVAVACSGVAVSVAGSLVGVAEAGSVVGVTEAGSVLAGRLVDSTVVSTVGVSVVSCWAGLAEDAGLLACAITGTVPIMPKLDTVTLIRTKKVIALLIT